LRDNSNFNTNDHRDSNIIWWMPQSDEWYYLNNILYKKKVKKNRESTSQAISIRMESPWIIVPWAVDHGGSTCFYAEKENKGKATTVQVHYRHQLFVSHGEGWVKEWKRVFEYQWGEERLGAVSMEKISDPWYRITK
jgi:hypothetical protein